MPIFITITSLSACTEPEIKSLTACPKTGYYHNLIKRGFRLQRVSGLLSRLICAVLLIHAAKGHCQR